MLRRSIAAALLCLGLSSEATGAEAAAPPSVPAVDAPALAALGPWAVGVESLTLTQGGQPNVLAYDAVAKIMPTGDRVLPLDIWYPALKQPGARPVVYAGALSGEDRKDVAFTAPGIAVRGAPTAPGRFPMIILAHGYGGTPVAMTWLAENLASKGYVVVGPHFRDPPYGDGSAAAGPLARRPLDIAFVASQAQARARAGQGALASADPGRVALIGYSMGGYGVLTAAGATLQPALVDATHGVLGPFVVGAPRAGELKVDGVKAVVAISPAGLFGGREAWGASGLARVTAPMLIVVGSQDHVVGYDPGARTLWTQAVAAPRYLLTFLEGGHSIGMNPAPDTMRDRLWDQDWFEDPVWRKERVIGIELQVITAFLDRYVKGDAAMAAYLDVAKARSDDGVWPAQPGRSWAAVSPGAPETTLWKGFQRGHAAGLTLEFAPPAP
jgi:predicted dienelactone hydrolase